MTKFLNIWILTLSLILGIAPAKSDILDSNPQNLSDFDQGFLIGLTPVIGVLNFQLTNEKYDAFNTQQSRLRFKFAQILSRELQIQSEKIQDLNLKAAILKLSSDLTNFDRLDTRPKTDSVLRSYNDELQNQLKMIAENYENLLFQYSPWTLTGLKKENLLKRLSAYCFSDCTNEASFYFTETVFEGFKQAVLIGYKLIEETNIHLNDHSASFEIASLTSFANGLRVQADKIKSPIYRSIVTFMSNDLLEKSKNSYYFSQTLQMQATRCESLFLP